MVLGRKDIIDKFEISIISIERKINIYNFWLKYVRLVPIHLGPKSLLLINKKFKAQIYFNLIFSFNHKLIILLILLFRQIIQYKII